jgi:hypothetical protein
MWLRSPRLTAPAGVSPLPSCSQNRDTAPSAAFGQEPGFGVAGASALSAGREEGSGLADGHRQFTDSWVGLLLRDAPATGCAPRVLAAGTGLVAGPGGAAGFKW